ncbi:hypothetical protein A2V71_03305 [Candidatus Berkelbacteria bacterium RBG_13_40_8]|uniref:Glycosyltransferase 2-like domain-containing protein n=1 Tax=Candidatus Berkelbacteria bacterium RBG_13_40_8 TaxID=1797467 RepID=A0A1F5DMB6_9BACT|nr:MAG: hypothetical protein A2V71_03305 [Candidatus Berkelbacteria bacterium RBG_13_40_8]
MVIPAKNEEKTMVRIVEAVKKYADEIIVIDGHSKDRTREIAKSQGAIVFLDKGKGKGEAIRMGIKKAKGEITVFIDADLSHDPRDIPKLLQPIRQGKADLVIGSRRLGGSDELFGDLDKFIRETGSQIINLGINYFFKVRITDSQNGLRAIKTEVARLLGLEENVTTIEQEMLIKALKKGYRVVEVAAHEYKRKYGDSSIKLRRVWWRYLYSWIKYLIFS